MEFTNPLMLYGLAALALPIVIHLFNFRRHKLVYFSNVYLLRNLQQQTQRTNQLKHLIVMLLRMLLIAALVLAFARPYLPGDDQLNPQADKLVVYYIDNSLSMQASGARASVFDEARQLAMTTARQFQRNDLFVLLTNDLDPVHEIPMTADEFITAVEQLEISPATTTLSQINTRLTTIDDPEQREERLFFYISDFQKSRLDFQQLAYDSTFRYYFVPMEAPQRNNIYVDSLWFDSPVLQQGHQASLKTVVVNHSDESVEGLPVRLMINAEQRAIVNADLAPNSRTELFMRFTNDHSGHFRGRISLNDFPVVFDDDLYFSYEVVERLNVLEIFEQQPNPWLDLLLSPDTLFHFESRSIFQLDHQALSQYDLIFLHGPGSLPTGVEQGLLRFVESGGSLALIPSEDVEKTTGINSFVQQFGQSYTSRIDSTRTRVFSLLDGHELFQDVFVSIPDNVDFPAVLKHYPINIQGRTQVLSLIDLLNGRPFLTATPRGEGTFYMFASPIHDGATHLQRNALFVPLIYRMAFLSRDAGRLYYTLGGDPSFETRFMPAHSDQVLHLSDMRSDYTFIPEQRSRQGTTLVQVHDMIQQAGHFGLFAADSLLQITSWNYDRRESVMDFMQGEALEEALNEHGFPRFEQFSSQSLQKADGLAKLSGGTPLWKVLLIIALACLLAEGLVLRFWK